MKNRITRYLEKAVFSGEFSRQMRFIAGPRQSGKTTIAKSALEKTKSENYYYNWDKREVRERYRKEEDFLANDLLKYADTGRKIRVCFDEIHKYPKWKNILKGFFDTYENKLNIIVTGSARLDMFNKAGDSLSGRYFLYRLNPLMMAEVIGKKYKNVIPPETALKYVEKCISNNINEQETMEQLIRFSGFPEPFIRQDAVFSKNWHAEYMEKTIKEDLRDLSAIHQLEKVADLGYLLLSRISAPLSVNSLKEDLELNFNTVKNYIKYLVLSYAIFEVPPYSKKGTRLVKKEKKVYFYDYAAVTGEAEKYENYVAVELKARVDLWNSTLVDTYALCFLKTRDGKETDFLITKNSTPFIMFEAKLSSENIEKHHYLHSEMLGKIPYVQLTAKSNIIKVEQKNFFVVSASRYFA